MVFMTDLDRVLFRGKGKTSAVLKEIQMGVVTPRLMLNKKLRGDK